jgi:hypothetical protein
MAAQSAGHRWRLTDAGMNPAEIIPSHEDRRHDRVVLEALADLAVKHFHMRSNYPLAIGVANSARRSTLIIFHGVSRDLLGGSVALNQNAKVHSAAKAKRDVQQPPSAGGYNVLSTISDSSVDGY